MRYTNQSAFDEVVKHSRTQKVKSMNPDGSSCVYRGPEGNKCWIGCLIPDNVFAEILIKYPEANATYASAIINAVPAATELFADVDLDLLGLLQRTHDMEAMADWEHCLKKWAVRFNLTMPE